MGTRISNHNYNFMFVIVLCAQFLLHSIFMIHAFADQSTYATVVDQVFNGAGNDHSGTLLQMPVNEEMLPAIVSHINDTSKDSRMAVCTLVRRIHTPKTIMPLVTLASSEDNDVSLTAIYSLMDVFSIDDLRTACGVQLNNAIHNYLLRTTPLIGEPLLIYTSLISEEKLKSELPVIEAHWRKVRGSIPYYVPKDNIANYDSLTGVNVNYSPDTPIVHILPVLDIAKVRIHDKEALYRILADLKSDDVNLIVIPIIFSTRYIDDPLVLNALLDELNDKRDTLFSRFHITDRICDLELVMLADRYKIKVGIPSVDNELDKNRVLHRYSLDDKLAIMRPFTDEELATAYKNLKAAYDAENAPPKRVFGHTTR